MKILHIITGLGNGGAESVLYRLCSNDITNKHIVISLTTSGKYGFMLNDKNIDVFYLNLNFSPTIIYKFIKLYKLILFIRPDVVQTWMYHSDLIGGVLAKLAGVKKIFWNIRHTSLDKKHTKNTTRIVAKCCAYLSAYVPDAVIYCAESSMYQHKLFGYNENTSTIIPNGYDLSIFQPKKTPHSFSSLSSSSDSYDRAESADSSIFTIGCVARYTPEKNHINLFKALQILYNKEIKYKCLLVGPNMIPSNGFLLKNLSDYNLNDSVYLLGESDNVCDFYNSIDLHVLPSLTEGFPNVIAEAMACGIPCVSTDVGDASLIINGNGWIVPSDDPISLSTSILEAYKLLQDNAKWSGLKKSCRNNVIENFSLDKMLSSYKEIWSS